jgi:hypothetical protein
MSAQEQDMTDMDNAERLDLASRVFYYFRQQAGNTDPPVYEYLDDQDLMAALIGDMRHYADWRGIDFGRAVAAGNSAYFQHRNEEEYPYSLGEEVEHPQPRTGQDSPEHSASLARRGVVTSIYPERDRTQTYYVRFLGETDSQPLTSVDLQPAPAFPRIVTSQGILESLAEAERLLVETGARIRSCQLRDAPPAGQDIADRDKITTALAEACDLTAENILRLLEPQVTAWTAEIGRPWRPVPAIHPAQLAALGFPHAVQPPIGTRNQDTDPSPRTAPAQRAGTTPKPR